ncbi:MAG: glycerophosphodiester phosphodiesterase family protein [Pseudomonadota bacterium]
MRKVMMIMLAAAIAGCSDGAAPSSKPASALPQWQTLSGGPPLVIAHRGASGYRPEHTLEAYKLAIEMGADVVEPDLVVTKDGVLVARHDRYLSTTTNVADKPEFADRKKPDPDPNGDGREDWWVEDFTLAELKTLGARQPRDARSKEFDDQFEIPTFDEMLALVSEEADKAGRQVGVYPETKHPGYFASIGLDFKAPLLAALNDFDAGPVFIQSFEPGILKRLKGKTEAHLVQLVFEPEPNAGVNMQPVDIARYADGIGAQKTIVTENYDGSFAPFGSKRGENFIKSAHDLNLFVHVWTMRDDEGYPPLDFKGEQAYSDAIPIAFQYRSVFSAGVDGVFADFPDTSVKARTDHAPKRR